MRGSRCTWSVGQLISESAFELTSVTTLFEHVIPYFGPEARDPGILLMGPWLPQGRLDGFPTTRD